MPELGRLLHSAENAEVETSRAVIAVTRAQVKREAQAERPQEAKERKCRVQPKSLAGENGENQYLRTHSVDMPTAE